MATKKSVAKKAVKKVAAKKPAMKKVAKVVKKAVKKIAKKVTAKAKPKAKSKSKSKSSKEAASGGADLNLLPNIYNNICVFRQQQQNIEYEQIRQSMKLDNITSLIESLNRIMEKLGISVPTIPLNEETI